MAQGTGTIVQLLTEEPTNPHDGLVYVNLTTNTMGIVSSTGTKTIGLGAEYIADTGAEDALVLVPNSPWTSYVEGKQILTTVKVTNTGAATMNISSLGVKDIKCKDGSALSAGDLVAGGLYIFAYDGTQFQAVA